MPNRSCRVVPLLVKLNLMLCVMSSARAFVIDADAPGRRFDGHGGLSAGASSRLLFDYPEPTRSDILDYLYKPNFGAALSVCKVEIGGDVQSTNGAEASHQHTRYDLNFERGYEYWLMAEAKKRNPAMVTYALSWGTPGWIGNGSYFSDDNIAYQTAFLIGARDQWNITVDFVGVWNERPWGNVDYIKKLRASLDAHGLRSTTIVGSDGGVKGDQLAALAADAAFASAEPVQGTHYPCARDQPPQFWEVRTQEGKGLTYWANEDFSTQGGDWAGGSCWGRSLSQNFVKLNATATISWSTIWSVYDSWRYYGNGLMYAMEPWSGNYSVPPAIWTSAHVNQFAAPGWRFASPSGSAGLLPGGGSWHALVPPISERHTRGNIAKVTASSPRRSVQSAIAGHDVTIVVEKLEGDCLRCRVPATTAEWVNFTLTGTLRHTKSLAVWRTNASHHFIREADVAVRSDGSFSYNVPRDTMLTFSTTTGQTKGAKSTGSYKPFPFPFQANYDDQIIGRFARYHADNAGAFEVAPDDVDNPNSGRHLLQASPRFPAGTEWAANYDPITSLGATDWANYRVRAAVMPLAPPPAYATPARDPTVPLPSESGMLTDPTPDPISAGVYAGVCVRQMDQYNSGFCLLVGIGLVGVPGGGRGWVLQAGTPSKQKLARVPGTILANGTFGEGFDLGIYHQLELSVQDQRLDASIDGVSVFNALNVTALDPDGAALLPPAGQAALRSGFHYARFDNVSVDVSNNAHARRAEANGGTVVLFEKHLLWPPKPPPGGPQDPVPALTKFNGDAGCAFTVGESPLPVEALGRFSAGTTARGVHTLSLLHMSPNNVGSTTTAPTVVATATLDLSDGGPSDLNGYRWAALTRATVLQPGERYYVVSSENSATDTAYSGTVLLQSSPGALVGFPTPVSRASGSLSWDDAGAAAPQASRWYHSIKTALTGQCWDTAGAERVDTWTCVDDGHNERFNYSAATGAIYASAKADNSPGADLCVTLGPCSDSDGSVCRQPCTPGAHNQTFMFNETDGTLRVRAEPSVCLQATQSRPLDSPIIAVPCKVGTKAQQWSFGPSSAVASQVVPWGQCFGPLNVRISVA